MKKIYFFVIYIFIFCDLNAKAEYGLGNNNTPVVPKDTTYSRESGIGADLGLTILSVVGADDSKEGSFMDFGFGGVMIGFNVKSPVIGFYTGVGLNLQSKSISNIVMAAIDPEYVPPVEESDPDEKSSLSLFLQFIPYLHSKDVDFGVGLHYSNNSFWGYYNNVYTNKSFTSFGPTVMLRTYFEEHSSLNFYYQVGISTVKDGSKQTTGNFIVSINYSF